MGWAATELSKHRPVTVFLQRSFVLTCPERAVQANFSCAAFFSTVYSVQRVVGPVLRNGLDCVPHALFYSGLLVYFLSFHSLLITILCFRTMLEIRYLFRQLFKSTESMIKLIFSNKGTCRSISSGKEHAVYAMTDRA